MGKIILILGPHGVGKSTLFKYAKQKNDLIVFDGFELSTNGYDFSIPENFFKYQREYIKIINQNNNIIKKSNKNGMVIRSIEESSYYYFFYQNSQIAMEEYQKEFSNSNNIKVDFIFYLNADIKTLQERFSHDIMRDMQETIEWYEHKYVLYDTYWKTYPNVRVIQTKNKTTAQIYDEIQEVINET